MRCSPHHGRHRPRSTPRWRCSISRTALRLGVELIGRQRQGDQRKTACCSREAMDRPPKPEGDGVEHAGSRALDVLAKVRPARDLRPASPWAAQRHRPWQRIHQDRRGRPKSLTGQRGADLTGLEYDGRFRQGRTIRIIICLIENIDQWAGVHTGDSALPVAPALTLSDKEYQVMRNASLAVLREIGSIPAVPTCSSRCIGNRPPSSSSNESPALLRFGFEGDRFSHRQGRKRRNWAVGAVRSTNRQRYQCALGRWPPSPPSITSSPRCASPF